MDRQPQERACVRRGEDRADQGRNLLRQSRLARLQNPLLPFQARLHKLRRFQENTPHKA